ncbi:VSP [Hexamita inflata]|uniref:VSP n=1 Tax=Hexamita inflata TaxID=28002 RepID=A0AA86P524_9EUKA|nr:VSP [Hexamita inflata]
MIEFVNIMLIQLNNLNTQYNIPCDQCSNYIGAVCDTDINQCRCDDTLGYIGTSVESCISCWESNQIVVLDQCVDCPLNYGFHVNQCELCQFGISNRVCSCNEQSGFGYSASLCIDCWSNGQEIRDGSCFLCTDLYEVSTHSCIYCDVGTKPFNNQCVCDNSQGYILKGNFCVDCWSISNIIYNDDCVPCTSPTVFNTVSHSCEQCGANQIYENDLCMCDESNGHAVYGGICTNCWNYAMEIKDGKCLTCSDAVFNVQTKLCETCQQGSNLVSGICVCNVKLGYAGIDCVNCWEQNKIIVGNNCVSCDYGKSLIYGSGNECICKDGYIKQGNNCIIKKNQIKTVIIVVPSIAAGIIIIVTINIIIKKRKQARPDKGPKEKKFKNNKNKEDTKEVIIQAQNITIV